MATQEVMDKMAKTFSGDDVDVLESNEEAIRWLDHHLQKGWREWPDFAGLSDDELYDVASELRDNVDEDKGWRGGSPPPGEGDDELKWEHIFGEPRPQEEEGDDEDWEKIFGEPKPKDEPIDPSQEDEWDNPEHPEDDDEEPSWKSIFGDDEPEHYADQPFLKGKLYPHTEADWGKIAEANTRAGISSTWLHKPSGRQVVFRNGLEPIGQHGDWIHSRTVSSPRGILHVYHNALTGQHKALNPIQHKFVQSVVRSKPPEVKITPQASPVPKGIQQYEDDSYAGLPEHIKARYQLAEQKAQHSVEMWKKHLGDMAELHHENDRYKERLFDILSGIHGQVLRSEREPDQPGATFKHVLQMAQGMGVPNPPTGSMPELLKAIADHTQAQSQHVPMVDMYHRQAETLASKPDSPQHRIDVYGYYRRLPDEHAVRVAKRLGIEPGATPKDTRFRIASHIHSRTLGHPANKLPDTPDKMPTQRLQNTPVDSRAPTVAK